MKPIPLTSKDHVWDDTISLGLEEYLQKHYFYLWCLPAANAKNKQQQLPVWFYSLVLKDNRGAFLRMSTATTINHGGKHGRETTLDYEMIHYSGGLWKDVFSFVLRTDTRFINHSRNKAHCRLLLCVEGGAVSAGVQVQDTIIINRQFQMAISGGASTFRDSADIAYGGNLIASYALSSSSFARQLLRVMEDDGGNLDFLCAVSSQISLGNHSSIKIYANNRSIVSLSLRTSKLPEAALLLFIPAVRRFLGYAKDLIMTGW